MSDVTVRKKKIKMHVEGCSKLRTYKCPYDEGRWQYDIRFKWPSGMPFREKKLVPLPDEKLSEARALAWAKERNRHVVNAGESALMPAEPVETDPTVAEFQEAYLRHKNSRARSTTAKASSGTGSSRSSARTASTRSTSRRWTC